MARVFDKITLTGPPSGAALVADVPIHGFTTVVPKTADYTVVAGDLSGTLFTAGGEGAVTFTLPAPATALAGKYFYFASIVDQNMVITAGTGKIVAIHNATADTCTWSTSSQKIGAFAMAVCNGTKWIVANLGTGATMTVA